MTQQVNDTNQKGKNARSVRAGLFSKIFFTSVLTKAREMPKTKGKRYENIE